MKRKITLSTLEELSGAISHNDLANYLGGGSGNSYRDPYTFSEYTALGWAFQRGWVKLLDGNISYLTENYPSFCGHSGYFCSGYDGSTNNWDNEWYNNSWFYPGTSSSLYDNAYMIISKLVNQLPAELRARLSNVAFEYNSVMLSSGQYDPKSNTIYLQQLDYNTLFRECVHAIQENEGLCGTNHAAKLYIRNPVQFILFGSAQGCGDILKALIGKQLPAQQLPTIGNGFQLHLPFFKVNGND